MHIWEYIARILGTTIWRRVLWGSIKFIIPDLHILPAERYDEVSALKFFYEKPRFYQFSSTKFRTFRYEVVVGLGIRVLARRGLHVGVRRGHLGVDTRTSWLSNEQLARRGDILYGPSSQSFPATAHNKGQTVRTGLCGS